MNFAKCLLSWFFAVSMFCPLLPAQQASSSAEPVVPRLVNFSGKAADAKGKAISGIAGVSFAIYKEQYEGAPLWMETQNVQADAKGNYTVQLGTTKPAGLPLELFSSGEARWLGVRVNGEEEQPRVLLLSVPYALKAADAETLGGKPLSAFQLVAPQSTKGSPKNAAPPAEQLNEIRCAGGAACKTSFIPKFSTNGGSAKVNDSIISQSGTNVAIAGSATVSGNITSSSNLGVAGNVSASTATVANSSGAAIVGTSNGTSGGSDGVDGVTTSGSASGVAGINQSGGIGVFGTGGTGVFGTGSNYGFQTDTNVQQARTAGGWVKAMAYVDVYDTPISILRCFNSNLPGAAATTPPCGLALSELVYGEWLIDFGFEVDDRFWSATYTIFYPGTSIVATRYNTNTIAVGIWDSGLNPTGGFFQLIVY